MLDTGNYAFWKDDVLAAQDEFARRICHVLDQRYETWISVRAEGPKFIPGDTRPNRLFVDQLFSVKL